MHGILLRKSGNRLSGIVRVAVPIRHMSLFDYRCNSLAEVPVGSRVIIPFDRQSRVGIVVEHAQESHLPKDKIRAIQSVLDDEPAVSTDLLRTLRWTSEYYQQPIGEILWSALPQAIRYGRPMQPKFEMGYRLSGQGLNINPAELSRAHVQRAIVEQLKASKDIVGKDQLKMAGRSWQSALRQLIVKQWVLAEPLVHREIRCEMNLIQDLTFAQIAARDRILSSLNHYQSFLIQGVTGSGKTEVYLQAICKVLESSGQALMLVPEIGLTPQLEQRVQHALGVPVSSYHSGLTDAQRHRTWWLARSGQAQVVIGTRSAVFLPFKALAMIVIDEEHDTSFKQQERARYHARAVSIYRAAIGNFPVLCGTATPSLETVHAARSGRVETLELPQRATNVEMPAIKLIDLSRSAAYNGIAVKILNEISNRIERGEQSLIFINRRGFAPVIICYDCKWVAKCNNCDANLIFHASDNKLHCHHCLIRTEFVQKCPNCMSHHVELLQQGTQRVEQTLQNRLPGARIMRIDRDTTHSYAEFEQKLKRIQEGEVDVLVGTQMLSKGHHFPNVTLVGVLNVDQGFYSIDFRAMEQMVQQVLQVAGRAGRVEKPGEVFIQTSHPDSKFFDCIRNHDYLAFAALELKNREEAKQPPYSNYVLLRANSMQCGEEIAFLKKAHGSALSLLSGDAYQGVEVFDIVQSPIQKISNRYRAQLLTTGENSVVLRQFLGDWMMKLDKLPKKGKLRWSLDVDPVDFS